MTASIAELIAHEPIRPLRRAEYDQLVDAGVFDDERLELLEGRLVLMSPQGHRHSYVIQKLNMALVRLVGDLADVRVQCPIALSDISEPEPDFALVPADADVLSDHPAHPLLVVEVAASSLSKDRGLKAALYARAGLPEYWIIDVARNVVHVYRAPHGEAYSDVAHVLRGGELTISQLPGVTLSTAAFLPDDDGEHRDPDVLRT